MEVLFKTISTRLDVMYNTEYDMKYIVFASGQQTTNPLPRSPRVLGSLFASFLEIWDAFIGGGAFSSKTF